MAHTRRLLLLLPTAAALLAAGGTEYVPHTTGALWDAINALESSEIVVLASASQAGDIGALEGADIAAALTECGTAPCKVQLETGTYTDVCVQITSRDAGTRIIGKGVGSTILKPYVDLDDCTATQNGAMLQVYGSDNVELAHFEMDGDKEFLSPATCNENFCGSAVMVQSDVAAVVRNTYVHDLYIHDISGSGVSGILTRNMLVERVFVAEAGCNQSDSPCGCGVGDPGSCRGWDSDSSNGIGISMNDQSYSSVVRGNRVSRTTYIGIEVYANAPPGPCGPDDSTCASGVQIIDNDVTLAPSGIVVNSGQQVRIERNRVYANGATGGVGDTGTGILIAAGSVSGLLVADNMIYENTGMGLFAKPTGPGPMILRGNALRDNCQDHGTHQLRIGTVGATAPANITVQDNHIEDSVGCGESMFIDDELTGLMVYGGENDDDVTIDSPAHVYGLATAGAMTFGANATYGFAQGLAVTGTFTNSGGILVWNITPATCTGDLNGGVLTVNGSNEIVCAADD